MASILIVEDDKDIRDILKTYLKIENYDIYESETILDAKNIINKNNIDIILLDIMLPDGESIDDLPNIRSKNPDTGIIIISAKNTDRDKIFGIELGADDYITKPFNPREVIARTRSLLKRLKKHDVILKYKNLELLPDSFSVKKNNLLIELTSKEFEILYLLSSNPEKIFSRNNIIEKVWYGDEYITDRVIDVHISMIRSKIGKSWIKTVRNIGYKFNKNGE
ncbi:DNA-binding response regulator [Tepiditoga spiralis]|uniref:DNA-binding response regulator n=1 Tax=Tepiditoga spiralis TaxID=2108365 RepID=A0A7G1GB79_9BACT|nr:response regulator transcription factor [Tepiditoga spiralis]BBE31592.1 DNA-binding response regulator [Tepiditoga spiralis]